jgi:hypothetical protein
VKNLKLFSIVSFAVVVMGLMTTTSCKKGDTGATGAAGATGATGATGAAGPDSILYSAWTPLALDTVPANGDFEQSITANGITQSILDNGLILMYLSDGKGDVVNLESYITAIFSVGNIYLVAGSAWTGYEYRYILIPGGIATSSAGGTQTINGYTVNQLKAMTYSNAAKALSIPGTGTGRLKAATN